MSYGLFAALYDAGTRFSLIDSRERRDYVAGHWFGSTNIPLSLFSTRLGYLFQEPDFPIHFLDWQDKASAEAIHQLKAIGFNNITIHNTRKPAMMGRGFVKGEYVWSKAFGEVVAHEIDLPEVTPKQYLADYQDAQLFDVRPTAEYQDFTLPKSQSLPNSLLLANIQALKDTGKMSLLHCAGRTRSIIGAFTLMASGYDGPFAVFRGGTQAWQLDGYEREHDANRLFAADHEASDAVANFLRRWQIPTTQVTANGLGAFVADHKTGLLFDVSDDGATGQRLAHGVIKISGTNLIQQTDRSIARYHVPVILFDQGSGSRAAFAAFWLRCMGFRVTIAYLDAPIALIETITNTVTNNIASNDTGSFTAFAATQLDIWQKDKIALYDFRPSKAVISGHIANSHWQNISAILVQTPADKPIAIIADNSDQGRMIADCLIRHGWQIAGVYLWHNADFDMATLANSGLDLPLDESALFARRHHGVLQDARDYLAWEEALPNEIDEAIHDLWCQELATSPKLD
ncbi:rhodanese-like domain-containing protein [Alphaproteobacteria bacterium]|nr:rhodanese-like domain-containing protein [Alphaproteobacteria bacterium]